MARDGCVDGAWPSLILVKRMGNVPSLDVVIVNWNAGEFLARCLQSIQGTAREDVEVRRVVVVDNASSDGSGRDLNFPGLPLQVVSNTLNRGFAVACNQGARGTSAEYLLFLNPDVRLQLDSLRIPLRFMEDPVNGRIGICGIQLLDESGHVSRTCSWFPTGASVLWQMLGLDRLFPRIFRGHFLKECEHQESATVDQVMGAFLLIRRALFEALGGFDERFFVYYEDLDLSYRAKRCGWSSYYLASTQAWHKGCGCSDQVRDIRLFYSLRSRILYAYKHFSRSAATLVLLGTILLEPFSRLAWAGLTGSLAGMRETVKGYAMLWRALPSMVAVARRERWHVHSMGTD